MLRNNSDGSLGAILSSRQQREGEGAQKGVLIKNLPTVANLQIDVPKNTESPRR